MLYKCTIWLFESINMNNSTTSSISGLDEFDKAILRIVQDNNQFTHAQIGQQVGLSVSAIRRRLAVMRDTGIIDRDVSLLKSDAFGVTLIVSVSFAVDTPDGYLAFDDEMAHLPNVKQSYHVSGATDYVLIVQGPSLSWFETWAKQHLMSNEAIQRHDTAVVWSRKKFETSVTI